MTKRRDEILYSARAEILDAIDDVLERLPESRRHELLLSLQEDLQNQSDEIAIMRDARRIAKRQRSRRALAKRGAPATLWTQAD